MAFPLFNALSQDNPFDPSDRHLWMSPRRTGAERRADREHRKKTGEKPKEREARESREAREAKEKAEHAEKQAELFDKMTDKLTAQKEKIGGLNHDKVLERLEKNRDSGELTAEQLTNLDDALLELAAIHEKQGELTSEDYGELIRAFNMKHVDIIMTPEETAMLRKMVEERLDYYDGQEAKIDEAHETRDLSELEELALAFVTNASGDNPEVGGDRLRPGAEYTVDFHDETGKLNRFAHNNVTLGHILSGTGLVKVEVEKKNGWKGEAYLHPNGKAYTNAPWETSRGNYVGIVSGDKFTVLADSYAAKSEGVDVEDEVAVQKAAEASRERSNYEVQERHIDRVTLEEAERQLESGYKVDIPEDVKVLRGADLEAKLISLDMGDYVVKLCEEFAGLPKSIAQGKTGTRLFIDIMEHGNRSKISLNEITQAVLGENSREFVERYEANKKEAEVVRWTEHFMVQEKTENPDMTAKEFRQKAKDAMAKDEDKIILNKYTGAVLDMFDAYEVGQDSTSARTEQVTELFRTRRQNKEFMLRAHRLLQAVPQMKNREYAATGVDRSIEKSEDLQGTEVLLEELFPSDELPAVKQGLISSLARRHGETASMGNVGERTSYDESKNYERLFTGLYANNHIRSEVVYIEDGVEHVDQEKLVDLLNMYRVQGRLIADQNAEKARREGRRAMTAEGTEITVENLADYAKWSPGTMALIRYGMQVEQMKEYGKLKEAVIETYPADIANALRAMEGKYDFTPDELQEIGNNIKTAQSTLLHATYSEVQHLNAEGDPAKRMRDGRPVNPVELNLGATHSFTVYEGPNSGTISMNMGFNMQRTGDKITPKSFDTNFGFQLGPSYNKSFGAEGRNSVGVSMGVAGMPAEEFWGAGGSLTLRHNWGEYQTWASGVNVGVGAQLGGNRTFMETLSLINLGVTLVDINHENVIEKRASRSYEQQKEFIKGQMDYVEEAFDGSIDSIDGMSPDQIAQLKEQLLSYYEKQIVYDEIDDLSTIQFNDIGVQWIPYPPHFMPKIGIAIKGKTKTIYVKSKNFDVSEHANQALAAEGGSDMMIFDVSGDLMFNEQGAVSYERSSDKAYNLYKNLEAAQEYYLEEMGLLIERVGESGQFRLVPVQADGIVEVYADAGEGISAKTSTKGEVLFSIPELTDLAIQKHTHVMPLPDGGVQEITKIYLTDNPRKNPEQVQRSQATHLEGYVSHRDAGRNSVFEDVRHIGDNEVIRSGEVGPENFDDADVLAAQAKVDEAFATAERAGISPARYKEMKEAVIAAKPRINARMQGSPEAYRRALLDATKPLADQLGVTGNAEMTALIQLVLIEDRSVAPTDPEAFINHIVAWNQPSITASLKENGIDDPALANTLSAKISTAYANKMLIALKQNGNDHLPSTPVEMSAFVQTHIGGLPQGNVMEFLNGAADQVTIEGALQIEESVLKDHFGIEGEEAKALIKAFTEQMAPLDLNNMESLLQHPIGLQLLQNAAAIFGPEMATALAAKDPAALEEFKKVMEGLTAEPGPGLKTLEYKGREIKVFIDMKMGYLYKCRNFTTTYKASMPEVMGAGKVRTIDFVEGDAAVNLAGVGVVGGVEVKKVPHERTPPGTEEPPPPEGQKDPEVQLGDDRDDIPGSGTGGSTGGASGEDAPGGVTG